MKLILDLDEQTMKNMQGYTTMHNITINELVTDLFNKYVQEPANVIDKIHAENGDLRELQSFRKLLMSYFNEAIYDIEESSRSDEAYDTDEAMAHVFRKLNRDHLENPYILTDLFMEYKKRS